MRSEKHIRLGIILPSEPLRKKVSWKGLLLSSSKKVSISFLPREFRTERRPFLEDFVSTINSTVATPSLIGHCRSCICPEYVIGGDDYQFVQLLDGLLEHGWVRGPQLRLQRLNVILSSAKGDKWRRVAADHVPQATTCLSFVTSLALAIAAFCTKLVSGGVLNNLNCLWFCCFQVFQLITVVVRGLPESHLNFTVFLNRSAIDHEEVEGAVAFAHDFARNPLITSRSFFSETRVNMLNTAVAAADVVQHSFQFDRWRAVGVETDLVSADLKSCREKILLRWKAVKDARERWFAADSVASLAVAEAAPRQTVRISDIFELRDVQNIDEYNKFDFFDVLGL